MMVVDEHLALLALAGRPHPALGTEPLALSYGRAYRLTRALLDYGPGRLALRGRFSRLVDLLAPADQRLLHDRLARPDPAVLSIIDPRPTIRTAGAIQNTYAVSLLQAETLAVSIVHDWRIVFIDGDSASDPFRRATTDLGLNLQILDE
ncbi:hypothetical protein BH20ACT2_BH20ACT2_19320 [soil metagenome]